MSIAIFTKLSRNIFHNILSIIVYVALLYHSRTRDLVRRDPAYANLGLIIRIFSLHVWHIGSR